MLPLTNTAGRRRDARRVIRNVLGTSRDDAPTVLVAIRAAQELDKLMLMASGGRFGVAILEAGSPRRELTWAEARQIAREGS